MLYVLFGLLFLYERKAINMLVAYIGMTITMAIIVGNSPYIRQVEGEYLSYILILVQVSALTILFGFIIMLFPRSSTTNIPPQARVLIITGLALLLIELVLVLYPIGEPSRIEGVERVHTDIPLLRTIGELLYTDNTTIVKLMVVTLILLVAIVGLFFLITI